MKINAKVCLIVCLFVCLFQFETIAVSSEDPNNSSVLGNLVCCLANQIRSSHAGGGMDRH